MPSLELDLFYGLLGAILFRIRNEQTHYQNWIFGFVIGLFLSQALFVYGSEIVSQIIWVISASGLGVAYFLRFIRKVSRTTIDFLKLACIVLLIIYPITFYTIVPLPGEYWGILRPLTLPCVAVIYIYDRWVLKKENMKRKFVIVLVAQTLLILALFTFALIQKAEADKQREIAVEQRELAVEQAKRAEKERFIREKIRLQLDSLKEDDGRP
jgi:hypothetical protein